MSKNQIFLTLTCVGLLFGTLVCVCSLRADDDTDVSASPKRPWGDFTVTEDTAEEHHWWEKVLLWAPNRILDFIDIFRIDVGAGPSVGAVIRISRYGQLGYRNMMPASVRVGDFGRSLPVMVERSNEFGIGPGFVRSRDRKVCPGEIGAGVDLFIVGGYGGICIEELFDFVAGIFFLDVSGDDVR